VPWHDVTFDLAFANGAVLLAGIVLYALLGGADFGGGVWDLLARGPRADQQRQEIARAIGPIWEANHVWLIFSLVAAFTVFPKVFADTANAWADDAVVLITGRVDRRDDAAQLLCETVHAWDDAVRMGPLAYASERERLARARSRPGQWSGNGGGNGHAAAPPSGQPVAVPRGVSEMEATVAVPIMTRLHISSFWRPIRSPK